MDFETPVRRPMEKGKKQTPSAVDGDTDEPHDITSCGPLDFDADCGWSAITDAPARMTQNRSAQLLRLGDNGPLSSITRVIMDKDSPIMEQMMNQLLIEVTSPLAASESAERQLDLTISPHKPGQKRGRETPMEDECDDANVPREKPQPFQDGSGETAQTRKQ